MFQNLFIFGFMLKVFYLKVSDFETYPDDYFFPQVSRETLDTVVLYKKEKIRRTKLLGEAMSRNLLASVLGVRDCRIVKGEHGKPYVEGGKGAAFFNLSHSGDYIVCAVSTCEVGVDIEQMGRMRMEVARRFFHPGEVAILEKLSDQKGREMFFGYWSAKESFLKYTGSGLSSPLCDFEVCFDTEEISLKKEHSRIPVYVRECFINSDYRCFVCSACSDKPEISLFRFG